MINPAFCIDGSGGSFAGVFDVERGFIRTLDIFVNPYGCQSRL
jgi:hypothetical protein